MDLSGAILASCRWGGEVEVNPVLDRPRPGNSLEEHPRPHPCGVFDGEGGVGHFGVTGDNDRYELLITHNFVIGWFVRQMLDAPVWRWIGLNQAHCAITIVQWESDRPPILVSFSDTGHL